MVSGYMDVINKETTEVDVKWQSIVEQKKKGLFNGISITK